MYHGLVRVMFVLLKGSLHVSNHPINIFGLNEGGSRKMSLYSSVVGVVDEDYQALMAAA